MDLSVDKKIIDFHKLISELQKHSGIFFSTTLAKAVLILFAQYLRRILWEVIELICWVAGRLI